VSHNKYTVNTSEPNRNSQLTININDINDVSLSSAVANQILTYDGTNWYNSAVPSGLIFAGEGDSQNYNTSSASGVSVSDNIEFYASNPTNSLGATITSASGWISSITLTPGTYKLQAVAGLELSASSGLLEYRWHDGTNYLGATGNCGYTDDRVGNPCVAIVSPTSNTTYTVKITTSTSITPVVSQGSRHSQRGYILIERVVG
jgi:hypothetical protein